MNLKTTTAWIETTEDVDHFVCDKWDSGYISQFPKVEKQTGYFHSREELEKIIGDAFDAGVTAQFNYQYNDKHQSSTEYINNLLKHPDQS